MSIVVTSFRICLLIRRRRKNMGKPSNMIASPPPPPPFLLWHKAMFPAIYPTFCHEKGRRKKGKNPRRESHHVLSPSRRGGGGRLSRPPSLFLGFPPPPPLFLFREILNQTRVKLVGKAKEKVCFSYFGEAWRQISSQLSASVLFLKKFAVEFETVEKTLCLQFFRRILGKMVWCFRFRNPFG